MATKKSTAVTVKGASKSTEVGEVYDWKKEMENIGARVQATAEQAVGNQFSVRNGQLKWKGADVQDSQMDVIILDVGLENSYYEDTFDPDNPKPPTCFALGYDVDEMAPHDNSAEKQNENCGTCQWNKFGSAAQGKGKACKNIRRAILIPANTSDDLTTDAIMGAELGVLKVPVTSVANLNAHLNNMRARLGNNAPFLTTTRVIVRPDPKTQISIKFEFPDPKKITTFPEKLMPAIVRRYKEAEKMSMQPYQQMAEEEAAPVTRKKAAAPAKKPGKRKY